MSLPEKCFHANCTPLWSSLGTEETHTEAGGRETRIGRLDPPIVWSDDGGEFAVERFCVCVKSPVKGVVRLLCNGAPDGNFYGRVFARLRMADKYDWKREQADEKLTGELYEMIRADTAAAKAADAQSEGHE